MKSTFQTGKCPPCGGYRLPGETSDHADISPPETAPPRPLSRKFRLESARSVSGTLALSLHRKSGGESNRRSPRPQTRNPDRKPAGRMLTTIPTRSNRQTLIPRTIIRPPTGSVTWKPACSIRSTLPDDPGTDNDRDRLSRSRSIRPSCCFSLPSP